MLALVTLAAAAIAAAAPAVTHHQAAAHPMRYHVALPQGWTAGKSWPVVVVVADAHRDFVDNLQRFVAVRGARPFLLVAPEVTSCGGAAGEATPPYSYSGAEWQAVHAAGEYAFDDAGLAAVLAEVHAKWGGETRAFLTGWEAGGHTVWAQTLRHPERWRAVAPVSTNYQGRGMDAASWSRDPARATLPVQVFLCGAPAGETAKFLPLLVGQTERAIGEARAHGFAPITIRRVPGRDHGPLPEAALAWFDSLAHAAPAGATAH